VQLAQVRAPAEILTDRGLSILHLSRAQRVSINRVGATASRTGAGKWQLLLQATSMGANASAPDPRDRQLSQVPHSWLSRMAVVMADLNAICQLLHCNAPGGRVGAHGGD
jgi:hypothetical protein